MGLLTELFETVKDNGYRGVLGREAQLVRAPLFYLKIRHPFGVSYRAGQKM
jgi:hypothetical protein